MSAIVRRFSSRLPKDGKQLGDFLKSDVGLHMPVQKPREAFPFTFGQEDESEETTAAPASFFVHTYGCQMNVSDTEIVTSILRDAGMQRATDMESADVLLVNTCSVRDNAEKKVWHKLAEFRKHKTTRRDRNTVIGVLGCMAERLKHQLLESDRLVDLVVGPDAYRDLPNLLKVVEGGSTGINTQLSADETYADIAPVRTDANGVSSFVSIMRGCNNMCTYCIVPFTRGRERSRDPDSIVREVKQLYESGYREVTLLGQNVNSYNYVRAKEQASDPITPLSKGFGQIYKSPPEGVRFAELVRRTAEAVPEMRIRFTSPHPKDFPDPLLDVISTLPNVCNNIHIPAQSGNTEMLDRMGRQYTREAYLELIDHIRHTVPGIGMSSDFIVGFCGETEQQHVDSLTLMDYVGYDLAYMFAYSQREKTRAHRRFEDDVPEVVKKTRLHQMIQRFYEGAAQKNIAEVGKVHLVLLEKTSKRSREELMGRTDNNKKVVVPNPGGRFSPGQYVAARVTHSSAQTLRGEILSPSSISDFHQHHSLYERA